MEKIGQNSIHQNKLHQTTLEQSQYVPRFCATNSTPSDTVEFSSKESKKSNKGFVNVLEMLAVLMAVCSGATFGGIKIYNKYFNKLAGSGLKFGEINEVLFNFIKKNDPKGNLFTSRNQILQLNDALTEENIPIFKQLAKMKNSSKEWLSYSNRANQPRFDIYELTKLIKVTNKNNLKYLTQLAEKVEKDDTGVVQTFSTEQIIKIIEKITSQNEELAETVIRRAKIKETDDLVRCLKDIDDKNIDIYKMLFNCRNKSGVTDLEFWEIFALKRHAEKQKNLDLLETLINTEKRDGSGEYRFSTLELRSSDFNIEPEKVPVLKKLLEMNELGTTGTADLRGLVDVTEEKNIEFLYSILSKKVYNEGIFGNSGLKFTFKSYDDIETIMKNITPENKSVANKLLELDGYDHFSANIYYREMIQKSAGDKNYLKKLESILAKNDEKLTIKEVFDKVSSPSKSSSVAGDFQSQLDEILKKYQ